MALLKERPSLNVCLLVPPFGSSLSLPCLFQLDYAAAMFSVLSALILLLIGSQLTGAILDYDADTMTSSLAPSPSSLLPSSICSTWANNSTLGPLVAIIVTPTNSGVILFRGRLSNADNLTVFQFPLSRLITNESAIQLKCKDGASLSSMALKDKWPTIYQSTPILQSAIQGITQVSTANQNY